VTTTHPDHLYRPSHLTLTQKIYCIAVLMPKR
jgi:hypothetical protein